MLFLFFNFLPVSFSQIRVQFYAIKLYYNVKLTIVCFINIEIYRIDVSRILYLLHRCIIVYNYNILFDLFSA